MLAQDADAPFALQIDIEQTVALAEIEQLFLPTGEAIGKRGQGGCETPDVRWLALYTTIKALPQRLLRGLRPGVRAMIREGMWLLEAQLTPEAVPSVSESSRGAGKTRFY